MQREYDLDGTPEGVFGGELRFFREQAGLTQGQLAARVHVSHDVISKIETGQRPPARDFPERVDAVPEMDTRGELARLWRRLGKAARQGVYPGWFRPWPDYEAQAVTLRWFELITVPGLLQTPDYARAVLRTRVNTSDDEIEDMVEARMARQPIMCEQLNKLIDDARLSNVIIQVIPTSQGAHEGFRGPFIIADFKDHPPVAYQDTAVQGMIVDEAEDVTSLMVLWDTLRSAALPVAASLELIEEVTKTWT